MKQMMFLVAALGVLGVTAPVLAQGAPVVQRSAPVLTPTPRYIVPTAPLLRDPFAPNDVYRGDRLQRAVWAQQLNRWAIAHPTAAQIKLAGQVQTLINERRCGPAAQLAFAEHEDSLAAQVPLACHEMRILGG